MLSTSGLRACSKLGLTVLISVVFFFLMIRRPPRSTLFPYTNALPISRLLWIRAPFAAAPRPAHASFGDAQCRWSRSEEHTSELQSQSNLVCRLLLEKKKYLEDTATCRETL